MVLRFPPAGVDLAQLVKGLNLVKNEVDDYRTEDIPDSPSWLWKITHLQPSLYAGAVAAIVALLASIGLIVSGKTSDSIITAIGIVVSIVQALWTKSKSTPNAKVVVYKPDPVSDPTTVKSGLAVSSDGAAVVNAAASTPTQTVELLPFIG